MVKELLGRCGLVLLKGVRGAAMESERVNVRAVFVAVAGRRKEKGRRKR